MRPTALAVLILAASVTPGPWSTARAQAPSEAERRHLLEELRTACTQFPRDDQWEQADACRRAFFAQHEEAIWRLNLNPHGAQAGPSS